MIDLFLLPCIYMYILPMRCSMHCGEFTGASESATSCDPRDYAVWAEYAPLFLLLRAFEDLWDLLCFSRIYICLCVFLQKIKPRKYHGGGGGVKIVYSHEKGSTSSSARPPSEA